MSLGKGAGTARSEPPPRPATAPPECGRRRLSSLLRVRAECERFVSVVDRRAVPIDRPDLEVPCELLALLDGVRGAFDRDLRLLHAVADEGVEENDRLAV